MPARAALARSPARQATLAGTVFFLLFVALRSRVYTAVDGAVRCLEVFHRGALFFHGNNHLLYPADVFCWHRLLALFGLRAAGPLDYLALTQVMNALAAAGCAAVLYRLTHAATGSWRAALAAACLWSFSRAFLLHATNAAEPMVGVLWSALAILLLALSGRDRFPWRPFAAGALSALALATYQSTILAAPLAAVLCWRPCQGRRDGARAGWARLLAAAAGGLAALVTVYGLAYRAQGVPGVGAKVARFLSVGGAPGIFGGPSLRKLALLPLGLAANVVNVLPAGFLGLRSLLRSPGAALAAAAAALAVVTLAILGAVRLRRAWPDLIDLNAPQRSAFVGGLVGFTATALGPAVWDPLYDKLWLQPLGCASFLAVLAVAWLPPVHQRAAWRAAGLAVLVAIAAANLVAAIAAHRRQTPYLAEAQRIAAITTDQDLVVHDWDAISVLYGTIWGWSPRRHRFDFPSSALGSPRQVRADLDREVAAAGERGGKVYFIGVLDQPKASWDVLLGNKGGVPYDVLAPYRQRARAIASFPYGQATVHLFLLPPPSP